MLSETAVAAIYTVGGAVIGALVSAFIQPLWTLAIGQKTKLSASVQIFSFDMPQYLSESITEYSEQRWNIRANIKPTADVVDKLRQIDSRRGYLRISLKNKSKREISGIRLHIRNNSDIIVDAKIDGTEKGSVFGKSFRLDSLLPNSTVELRIWTDWDYSDTSYLKIDEIVNITAKEIDQVYTQYIFTNFSKSKYLHISKNLAVRSYWLIIIFSILGQIAFQIVKN